MQGKYVNYASAVQVQHPGQEYQLSVRTIWKEKKIFANPIGETPEMEQNR